MERAKQNGATIEPALLDIIKEKRNAEANKERQHQDQLTTMSKQTEQIKSLIADIKKLRRDNVILNQEIESLNKDLRKWSSLAAIIAGISVAVSLAFVSHLVFSGPAEETTAELAAQNAAQINKEQQATKPPPTPGYSGIQSQLKHNRPSQPQQQKPDKSKTKQSKTHLLLRLVLQNNP